MLMVIELLQEIGLNKYEAEAYTALLQHGPLTGYELGKRSGVPLSRSYEILERLVAQGMALVQPGDPPRYTAEAPEQLINRKRAAVTATFDSLAGALAEIEQRPTASGFWVVRGRAPILAHAQTLLAGAQLSIGLKLPPTAQNTLEPAIAQARTRGCRINQLPAGIDLGATDALLVIVDDAKALLGSLAPEADCQAVASESPVLIAALAQCFTPRIIFTPNDAAAPREAQPLDWLAWDERKQRGLLSQDANNRAAYKGTNS